MFSLAGDAAFAKRLVIYSTLLQHMSDEQRFQLTAKLCRDILAEAVDERIPLDSSGAAVVRDTLVILCSDSIKLSSSVLRHSPDDEEPVADAVDAMKASQAAALSGAKARLLTQIMRKNVVENVLPVTIGSDRPRRLCDDAIATDVLRLLQT